MLLVLLDWVPQVLQVWLELQVQLVYQEIKDQLVPLALPVPLVYKVYRALQVR